MEFGVLGPVEVWTVDGPVDIGGPKSRLLLAALIASVGRPVGQDGLADALWPDSDTAVDTLQSYVSRLRRRLGDAGRDRIERTERGYRLSADASVDARHFEDLAEEGRRTRAAGDVEAAAARLGDALDMWRGAAFGELGSEDLVRAEASRLDELRQTTCEDLIETQIELGHHATVVPEIEAMLESLPLRERLWELLMVALSRSGRQAEALRSFQRARQHLGEELGIEPSSRLRELEARVLRQDPGLLGPEPTFSASPVRDRPRLPAEATRFVGRVRELEEARAALRRARLVTLTGAPGVGKTRLATATARHTEREEGRAVSFVDVSDATERHEAKERIGAAARRDGLPDDVDFLLVVDNCEHLVDACAERIAELLSENARVQVIATSRESLRLPGEVVLQVPPMTVPSTDPDADLMDVDAVQLFVERCGDARPGFALTPANSDAVRKICIRLDGIPLALELAAARVATMGLREISLGLDRRFDLLTEGYRTAPARHRTLSAALEWSYRLLDEPARRLFDQLHYFLGDFHSLAAEVICADATIEESAVPGLLGGLVRSSLVTMEERAGEAVFRLLPMVREFLLLQRGRLGFGTVSRRGFVFHLAEWTEPRLRGPRDQMWRTLFDGPRDVARATLELAYHLHEIENGCFLAGALAARVTTTGRVGFVGGMRDDFLTRFERGFVAGARHVHPGAEPEIAYLTDETDLYTGFFDPLSARRTATTVLENGVDVVFHAAGVGGGQGVFEAAHDVSAQTGRHRWVIGVDVDEKVIRDREHLPHVLTSMRRQVPMAVYEQIKAAVAAGRPEAAPALGLGNEGVGLAHDLPVAHAADIRDLSEAIVSGDVTWRDTGENGSSPPDPAPRP